MLAQPGGEVLEDLDHYLPGWEEAGDGKGDHDFTGLMYVQCP